MKTLLALFFVTLAQAEVVTYTSDEGIKVTITYEKQSWNGQRDKPFANYVQLILEKQSYPYLTDAKVVAELNQYYNQYYGRFGKDQDFEDQMNLNFDCQADGLCTASLRRDYLWLWRTSDDKNVKFNKLEHFLRLYVDGVPVKFDGKEAKHIVLP